jgi:hypothetical protein
MTECQVKNLDNHPTLCYTETGIYIMMVGPELWSIAITLYRSTIN